MSDKGEQRTILLISDSPSAVSVEKVRRLIMNTNAPQPSGGEGVPGATDLLRSLIPKICERCHDGITVTQWGQRKNGSLAFTHWTGFEHAPCGASAVREFLGRATQPATTSNDVAERARRAVDKFAEYQAAFDPPLSQIVRDELADIIAAEFSSPTQSPGSPDRS